MKLLSLSTFLACLEANIKSQGQSVHIGNAADAAAKALGLKDLDLSSIVHSSDLQHLAEAVGGAVANAAGDAGKAVEKAVGDVAPVLVAIDEVAHVAGPVVATLVPAASPVVSVVELLIDAAKGITAAAAALSAAQQATPSVVAAPPAAKASKKK